MTNANWYDADPLMGKMEDTTEGVTLELLPDFYTILDTHVKAYTEQHPDASESDFPKLVHDFVNDHPDLVHAQVHPKMGRDPNTGGFYPIGGTMTNWISMGTRADLLDAWSKWLDGVDLGMYYLSHGS